MDGIRVAGWDSSGSWGELISFLPLVGGIRPPVGIGLGGIRSGWPCAKRGPFRLPAFSLWGTFSESYDLHRGGGLYRSEDAVKGSYRLSAISASAGPSREHRWQGGMCVRGHLMHGRERDVQGKLTEL